MPMITADVDIVQIYRVLKSISHFTTHERVWKGSSDLATAVTCWMICAQAKYRGFVPDLTPDAAIKCLSYLGLPNQRQPKN